MGEIESARDFILGGNVGRCTCRRCQSRVEARDDAVANQACHALLTSLLTHEVTVYTSDLKVVNSGIIRAYLDRYAPKGGG